MSQPETTRQDHAAILVEQPDLIRAMLAEIGKNALFKDADGSEIINHDPYRRPLRNNDNQFIDFTRRLTEAELWSNAALAANRTLLNCYDLSQPSLPIQGDAASLSRHALFHDLGTHTAAAVLQPVLERHLFSFLDQGPWVESRLSLPALRQFFTEREDKSRERWDDMLARILSLRGAAEHAQLFLVQQATGFLFASPAVPLQRNQALQNGPVVESLISRAYGRIVPAWARGTFIIDALAAVGLSTDAHAYWQFYLPTSLALVNYLHRARRATAHFARYLGALAEWGLGMVALEHALQRTPVRESFGTASVAQAPETQSSVPWLRMIDEALQIFGEAIAPELARGAEEYALLQKLADTNFLEQVRWADRLDEHRATAARIYGAIQAGALEVPLETFIEPVTERSTTHVHDDHRLLVIESGSMEFWPGWTSSLHLGPGDLLYVAAQRLHGSCVTSEQCIYHQPLMTEAILARHRA